MGVGQGTGLGGLCRRGQSQPAAPAAGRSHDSGDPSPAAAACITAMRNALIVVACVLVSAMPAYAQPRPAADPVDALLRQLERVINAKDRTGFPALFDAAVSKDLVTQHSYDLFLPGAVRTALFERSR